MTARKDRLHSHARRLQLDVVEGRASFSQFRFRVFPDASRAHDWHEGGFLTSCRNAAELEAWLNGYECGKDRTNLALAPFVAKACGR